MDLGLQPTEVYQSGIRLLRWRGAGLPGSPLVFLHGLGDGADIWAPVLANWPGGPMAAIAPDLPGHGGSDWLEPKRYTMDVLTEKVAATLQREGVRRSVIIGHSLGGRIALKLAASGRVSADRVIIVDVNPDPDEAVGTAVSEHLDALINGAPNLEMFEQQIASRMPLADRAILSDVLSRLSKQGHKSAAPGVRLPLDPEIKRLLDASVKTDGWAQLAALNCPVVILRGAFSSALDDDTAQRMTKATRLPAMSLSVPKSGHAIALEQPKALASQLAKAVSGTVRHRA